MTVEDKSLEEVFGQLDEIVEKLEESNVSLEDSFKLYHQGMELLKICNDKIDTVEKKMMVLDEKVEQHEL
ncbi:MAG: exodeoxyribonuclease VII small subunit [Tyzzerella sp.]|nr:exodeoxyribonuclease VII small subunit [Tyzzerella sp.]